MRTTRNGSTSSSRCSPTGTTFLSGRYLDREGQIGELMDIDYSIHFQVWRPETFLDLLSCARREARLEHEILAFEPCFAGVDDEFIFVLRVDAWPTRPAPPARVAPLVPERPAPSQTRRDGGARLRDRVRRRLGLPR